MVHYRVSLFSSNTVCPLCIALARAASLTSGKCQYDKQWSWRCRMLHRFWRSNFYFFQLKWHMLSCSPRPSQDNRLLFICTIILFWDSCVLNSRVFVSSALIIGATSALFSICHRSIVLSSAPNPMRHLLWLTFMSETLLNTGLRLSQQADISEISDNYLVVAFWLNAYLIWENATHLSVWIVNGKMRKPETTFENVLPSWSPCKENHGWPNLRRSP